MNPTHGDLVDPELDASAPPSRHDAYAALRHRDFRLILAAGILDTIGAEMVAVAVGWELYERTGSELDLGLVGLVLAIPVVALSLPAGQAADHFSRRGIVIVTQAMLAMASLGLAFVSFLQGPIPLVYGCVGLAGVANAFAFPARWALLPQLVPAEDFNNAITWRSSAWQVAAAIGPALGGLVLALGRGATPAYIVDIVACLLVIGLMTRIRARRHSRPTEPISWRTLIAGWQFVRRTELILATITLDLFAVLLGGAVTLLPVYAKTILHVGPTGLGWLRAAPSIGALSMAVCLAHRPPLRRAGPALLLAVAGFGVATIVFGLSRNVWLSLAMLFLTGAFDNISVVVRATLVQMLTPDFLRGRVSAVNSIFIGLSNELGGFESGLVAKYVGAVRSVVLGGIGTIVVVFGITARWPQVARLGRLDHAEPPHPPATNGS
jgi:MFS family permease